jgi:hypothetical protein
VLVFVVCEILLCYSVIYMPRVLSSTYKQDQKTAIHAFLFIHLILCVCYLLNVKIM